MNYSPELTGIGKYTGELGEYLNSRQYQVQVITGFPYYPEWKIKNGYSFYRFYSEIISGVNVLRCPLYIPKKPTGLRRMLQDLSFLFTSFFAASFLLCKSRRYAFIIVISPSILSGIVGLWCKYWNRHSQLIYHVQDLQIDAAEKLQLVRQSFLLNIIKRLEKKILEKSNIVSTISKGMQKRIQEKNEKIQKMLLFPNWVDDTKIFPDKSNTSLLIKLGIPEEKKIIYYSGAIGEKQGMDLLIQAAQWAARSYPELHFIISGNGPYAAMLEMRIRQMELMNIQIISLQPIEEFNQLLNIAWLHLILQKKIASDLVLPSKLTNIMAVGGLILATASEQTSLYEMIGENNAGMITEPEDITAFTNAIEFLLNHPTIVKVFKANAYSYSCNHLAKEKILNSFLAEIENQHQKCNPVNSINYAQV